MNAHFTWYLIKGLFAKYAKFCMFAFLFCQELTPLCACISIIVLTEQITNFKKRGHDSRTPVVSGLTQNMLYTFTLHTDHV